MPLKALNIMNLTNKILISLGLGTIVGLSLNLTSLAGNPLITEYILDGGFKLITNLFINALKMLVVPMVLFALIPGIVGIGDIRVLGRIGVKTFALYILTTAIAIATAILLALITGIGKGMNIPSGVQFEGKAAEPLTEVFAGIIPENIFYAMANGEILSVIFFSVFFGVALLTKASLAPNLTVLIKEMNEIIMTMVSYVISFSPVAVFCLMVRVVADLGIDLIAQLMGYFLVLVMALIVHAFVTQVFLLKLLTGLKASLFLSKIRSAQLFGFSTSSSVASIPITLQVAQDRLGVDRSTASFSVPFGATINMDGTAIMQGVATVFVANLYGIELGLSGYLTVVVMAVLASIGTAAVPSVGLVMLTLVFNQVGLPLEGIALILGIDRIIDMLRTVVNITGDLVVTTIVSKSEGLFDSDVFYAEGAGLIADE